jgi:hypothetical protein
MIENADNVIVSDDSLYKRDLIHRLDMEDHPLIAPHRPEFGERLNVWDVSIQQFKGTNIFQWYTQARNAMWYPHGPFIIVNE